MPALATEIVWQPQGGSTDISDPRNWGGTLPDNGDRKKFADGGYAGDYTVTIPAATAENPYRDYAGLVFDAVTDGQTVTLDATGTSWLQMGDDGQAWQDNVPFRVRPNDHIFDVDNAHDTSKAANNFGFSLTDGTISFKRDLTNGSVLTFNGNFNMAVAPDGTENQHRTVLFHDTNASSANSKIIFHSGESTLRNVQLRGKTQGNEFRVDGGILHVLNGLLINDDSTGVDTDAYMHVTGNGQVSVESSALWIGRNNDGRGVLRIDGNGKFTMTDGTIITYFPDGALQKGLLSIGGNGEWKSAKDMNVGHNGGTADILVEENGVFKSDYLVFGAGNGCNVSLTMQDDAYASLPNVTMMRDVAADQQRTGVITLKDNAVLDMKVRYGDWVNGASGDFTLNMSDNAKLRASRNDGNDWIQFGANNTSKITLNLAGGTIEKFGGGDLVHFQLRAGADSEYNFAGVTLNTQNFAIEGKADTEAPNAWHIAHQTAGTINIRQNGSGDGLDIRGGNGRNAMYLLEGGTLNVGNMIRVGHSNVDASRQWHSVFRQTGGQANISAVVNMCDSATMAEFELLGGRTRLNCLRGWNQSVARNANGAWATALFNGGTIEPWQNGNTVIYTMPELRLGAKGLTLDTLAYDNITIRAKFQNEAEGTQTEVDGLFVKTGAGTLKASMSETDALYVNRDLRSYHSITRIDQGTLLLTGAADAAFGKNITVKGGATLSLAGTAQTLAVDTLTLGDGTMAATLVMDAGDTVVVSGEDGLVASTALVDYSSATVNGEYPVFVCAGSADIDAVDGIGIIPNAAHDCEWTSSYDDGTDTTTFSIRVADAGTIGKTITYGDGSVTTNGEGRVARLIANESGSQYGQLDLTSAAAATVDAGATLTLGGDLRISAGGSLSKLGSGKLVVNGDNSGFTGSFASRGGTLEIASVSAFGPEDSLYYPLILGAGTLLYSDTENEAVFNGALRIDSGTAQKQTVLRNEGDITFSGTEYVSGAFTKVGAGTLKFDLPAGTFNLGSGTDAEKVNPNEAAITLPASGDAPENDGLAGVNIVEGTLKVKGQGVESTILQTQNTAILGGQLVGASQAVIDIEDAHVKWGQGGHTGWIGRRIVDGEKGPKVVLKNAKFESNSVAIGYGTAQGVAEGDVTIEMKDSEFFCDYGGSIGSSANINVYIDADNSKLYESWGIGIYANAKKIEADFYGADAMLGSIRTKEAFSNGGTILFNNSVQAGFIKIRDGARLKLTRGLRMNNSTLDIVFDGGTFEIAALEVPEETFSSWNSGYGSGIKTTGDGMALDICEVGTHSFNFPIYGDGKVVKTGAGTFKLVEARAEGEKLVQYTGGTVVSNGTLVVDGTLVADGAKSFEVAEGATLDLNETTLAGATISGAGVVTNGTLSAATIAYDADAVTTFDGVEFSGTLFVDFGRTAENPIDKAAGKSGFVVAHYTGDAPVIANVKALNSGIVRTRARATVSNGDIVVTVEQSGLQVYIR